MWIAFQLLLALVAFAARLVRPRRARPQHVMADGTTFFHVPFHAQRQSGPNSLSGGEISGAATGFRIGMGLPTDVTMKLCAEGDTHRFVKRVGLAKEVQTGHPSFDESIYVECDHTAGHALLTDSADARAAVLAAFEYGLDRIEIENQVLWLERTCPRGPSDRELELLAEVHQAFLPIAASGERRSADPFVWRALAVEGVAWAILGFAVGAFLEWHAHTEDYHLHPMQLVAPGLVVAVGLFALVMGLATATLRGSSRGHRILIECALVLLLGLPIASMAAIGDLNRGLDDGSAVTRTRVVASCELHEMGARHYLRESYVLRLVPEPSAPATLALPDELEVSAELCSAAGAGDTLTAVIAPGRFGLAWYQRLTVGAQTWTPP